MTPNLFIAQNTMADTTITVITIPLPWLNKTPHLHQPKLIGLGSIGFDRTQLIDPDKDDLQNRFYMTHIDLGITYTPKPDQTYDIRYQFLYQTDDATALVPIPGFWNNTIFFTFSLHYPDHVTATIPHRTQTLRSDRQDLAPTDAEPIMPDPTEQLPQEDDKNNND